MIYNVQRENKLTQMCSELQAAEGQENVEGLDRLIISSTSERDSTFLQHYVIWQLNLLAVRSAKYGFINRASCMVIKQSLKCGNWQQWTSMFWTWGPAKLKFKRLIVSGSKLSLHNVYFSVIPSPFRGPMFCWIPHIAYLLHQHFQNTTFSIRFFLRFSFLSFTTI